VLYCGVSIGKVKLADLVKASLPFVGVMYLVLMIITFFPELILFVPNALG
jgi:TRAP-type C4-dicarboxylate transport system permease large subunit